MVFTGDHQTPASSLWLSSLSIRYATKRARISSENVLNCAALGEAWVQPTRNSRMSGYRAVRFSKSNSDFKEACIDGQLMKRAIRVQRESERQWIQSFWTEKGTKSLSVNNVERFHSNGPIR